MHVTKKVSTPRTVKVTCILTGDADGGSYVNYLLALTIRKKSNRCDGQKHLDFI